LSIIDDEAYKQSLADALGVSFVELTLGADLQVPLDLANDIEAIFFDDLNSFAENFATERKAAVAATGVLRLFLVGPNAFSLVEGTIFRTLGINPVFFESTQELVAVSPSFDSGSNRFFVDLTIQARTEGTRGNVVADRIVVMNTPITGVASVTNLESTKGGTARESNFDLLNRLTIAISGANINTFDGYKKQVLDIPGFEDALVLEPGDPGMVRQEAGAVDIIAIGSSVDTQTIAVTVLAEGEDFILPFQPVFQILSAIGASAYTDGGGFTFVKDTGNFARSAQGRDKIVWDIPPAGPAASEVVTINYSFNNKIRDLQLDFDEEKSIRVPASDILIKEAIEILIDFEMTVIKIGDFPQADVETVVELALQDYLAALKLGSLVEFSDALIAAGKAEIDGQEVVDRLDGFVMAKQGDVLGTANIQMASEEFPRLGVVTFL